MNRRTTLSAANIKYLLVMHRLLQTEEQPRSVAIARELGVSKASVHGMLESMRTLGLIDLEGRARITLTETGKAIAAKYSACYDAMSAWLMPVLGDPQSCRAAVLAFCAELSEDEAAAVAAELTAQSGESDSISTDL